MANIKKTPKFKSYQQEASFWDSHNVSDYFDRNNSVTLDFSKTQSKKESMLTVRLQPEMKVRLGSVAQDMGIQPSTLARMWITEKLKYLHLA